MEYYEQTVSDCEKRFNTDIRHGLSEKEAQKRLLRYGRNILEDSKKPSVFARFFEQFNDFMIVILLSAAAISFVTSLLWGGKNITEPLIILAIVTLNATLGTVQEMRAEHSIEALKKMSSPTATVIRDSREQRINSESVVPGDIIKLKSGDMVCADCRLVRCNGLRVDESALTGETHEIEKDADALCPVPTPIGDIKNSVMASCCVTGGEGIAIAVKTGMDTEMGKIASLLMNTERCDTPLQKRLAKTGQTLGIAALFICGIIFIIGTLKKIPPFDMFMTSVSLAVAAIPEGLPAIVTILLALGVMRMSKHNAIVRHLPSVETLGSATVICTDKTGTLTQNKMKVSEVKTSDTMLLLRLCTLCSENGEYINPTDRALLSSAEEHGINVDAYKKMHKCTAKIPFDSERKRMSIISDGKTIVKGAIECILPLCTHVSTNHGTSSLTADAKRQILKDNAAMTDNALRVIAVAYRNDTGGNTISERDLTFVGLVGIYDPPRPEVARAVADAKSAGIRTLMITGDHASTALAVARLTGIAAEGETAVTGRDIDRADDARLTELLRTHSVFARVTPQHKLRIVTLLKKSGEITAMTGDGVNDAPALKGADIGCSMGINGTDVAKSASDIILTDDNFATIVYAVREGRAIYDNIKKSVKFLLSSNIGEILTVFFSIVLNIAAPLTAIELLWVNLVTDSLPAISLGLDPPDKGIMRRPPTDPKKGLFSAELWRSITLEGLMIGALSLFAYTLGVAVTHSPAAARTMSFFVLSVSQLVHAFNMRSTESVLGAGFFSNKPLVLSFVTGLAAQLCLIYVSPIAAVFDVVALDVGTLAICIALSFVPLILVELQKKLNSVISARK